jgi:mono/diheme cytochrome c family protein
MNKLFIAAMTVGTIATVSRVGHTPAREPAHTVWDSVYTAAQASLGDSIFKASGCVKCHGATLAGGDDGSPLVGPDFRKNWEGQTLQQLFDQIHDGMPPDNPKSIPRDQVTAIVAYLLAQNQFPAGSRALTDSTERLGDVKVVFTKP